ncbi:MAG TPA: glycosyltransferase [Dokdonella sp.]|uniref:glycosyltransferase family 2 protein n=1 Tax=Dokdonella sp. TaxID=2291710 RepID=UPI002D80002B|nr:glycosyltransferase [Dokdonella sp.]HET9032156.1 glycosyltransferase [Dokdonella sp.]
MPTFHHRPDLLPDWDGHRLRLSGSPGSALDIAIDGCRFIHLVVDQTSLADLALPFSPSGNACMELTVSVTSGSDEPIDVAFAIEIGRPGLSEAVAELRNLRPLGTPERLVASDAKPMQGEVVIIVPVYNAPEDVARCLDSVLAHSTGPSRLIVIDDASTDAKITPLLERYRGINGVEILANPKNLGFTATVNRGIALAGEANVVLLNADTEVAAHWLTGLRRALYSSDDIATVTAVSDNAGAFSVPELEQENPLPPAWSFAQTALAVWQEAGLAYPQLPTGNGFCMLIRRAVIKAIGALDVEAFPQGYGEENDFCQRACAAGYRHLIAGNVLVRHARSRSFGHERRKALGAIGMQVLRERWPRYEADVGASLFSFERRVLDWRVRRIYADAPNHAPMPRALCFGFDGELALASGYDRLMLIASKSGLALSRPDHEPLEVTAAPDATEVAYWLQRYAIDLVAVHESGERRAAAILNSASQRLGVPLVFTSERAGPSIDTCRAQIMHQRSFVGSKR